MGKKKRLNKFITKWIKSDLPEDRSNVLLLGVTRIPTSPVPARRPCSLPLRPSPDTTNPNNLSDNTAQARRSSFSSHRNVIRKNSSKRSRRSFNKNIVAVSSSSDDENITSNCEDQFSNSASTEGCTSLSSGDITPTGISHDYTSDSVMDRSVDSIGTCSLDIEASAEMSDYSEASSVGTLRSVNLNTPTPEPHLPSYLSLACTVNGYSTTTNYDPERLTRSRDTSPHRPFSHEQHLNQSIPTYSIHNNLLSPPNLVPLPTQKFKPLNTPQNNHLNMTDQAITQHHHHQQYYSSSKTVTFISKESRSFATNMFSTTDTVDAAIENGLRNGIQSKCVSYDNKFMSVTTNEQSKCTSTSTVQEYTNGRECKSFIQQRVERLYGPGALAQGFLVMKKQKNRTFSTDNDKNSLYISSDKNKHSKSMNDELLEDDILESGMKQSTSSPTLPVLRHLRPEFRAQLPIISPRKGTEIPMQKSNTVPVLKNEVKVNGHSHKEQKINGSTDKCEEKTKVATVKEESGEKDGHYFIKILSKEADRLLQLAEKTETELNEETLPEEITGKLRSASGKARLLVSQKMQQFKGLCTNNITQVEGVQFPTTSEDLQGFWDMVMLQVDQVDALFKEIDVLRANNWQELKSESVVDKNNTNGVAAKSRKLRIRPPTVVNEEAMKQRELQRKQMIEERRKAMRLQKQPKENIEIFVPESS